MAVIMVLSFKTPLRKLVVMGLDKLKRGRGPVVVKTVAGTIFVVLMSSVYSLLIIQTRSSIDDAAAAAVNPTDQVLMATNMLQSTLMGGILFFAFIIDRLHNYIRELRIRRKSMEALKNEARGFEDGKDDQLKASDEEKTALQEQAKKLESELEKLPKEVSSSKASMVALRKQSEGFLVEYDRLLEENQKLRNQLQALDRDLSSSDTKKNT
ncbi:hypothetical protein ACFE04_001492 [Oxalis oulophora]